MDNRWNKPPEYKATLTKRGLQPEEFEKTLISKLSKIFDRNVAEDNTISKTVNELRKKVCFRENKINANLDQRYRLALSEYVDLGLLPNRVKPPMQIRIETGGRPSQVRFDKKQTRLYHGRQHILFFENELLGRKFRELFPSIVLRENSKGYFYHQNGEKLTTEDACRVIDKFTTEFIRYLELLRQNNGQVPPGEWAPQNIPQIRSYCMLIVMGRYMVDWANDNDLLNHNTYIRWKEHIIIEMSYAALVVVLDMIIEQQQAVVALDMIIEQQPAVVALDMIIEQQPAVALDMRMPQQAVAPHQNEAVENPRLWLWCVMYTFFPKLIGFAFVHYSCH